MKKPSLCISIVTYHSDVIMLEKAIDSIVASLAIQAQSFSDIEIRFVINDDLGSDYYRKVFPQNITVIEFSGHGNIGFGRGHNLALLQSRADYYIIANPDVEFGSDFFHKVISVLQKYPHAGMISPEVSNEKSVRLYLCKEYPTIFLLFLRVIPFSGIKKWFSAYMRKIEYMDDIGQSKSFEPVIATGCLMIVRGDIFRQIGGFDPDFFLYFEDYDLTMRIAECAKVIYEPAIKIIHHGGGASLKGWRHIRLFIASAFRFFNKHGWRWY